VINNTYAITNIIYKSIVIFFEKILRMPKGEIDYRSLLQFLKIVRISGSLDREGEKVKDYDKFIFLKCCKVIY
jgi:hypothetical protein